MRRWLLTATLTGALVACAAKIPRPETLLNEDQTINLMTHPKKWDGKTVTIKIYPYDYGYSESYAVCFDQCDKRSADKSPFLIYTRADRFKGFHGDLAAVVTARYDARCFYRVVPCPDERFGLFTEVE